MVLRGTPESSDSRTSGSTRMTGRINCGARPPARVTERLGHVINRDETSRHTFDLVGFLTDVPDGDVANTTPAE